MPRKTKSNTREGFRICNICEDEKPLNDFINRTGNIGGKGYECKVCYTDKAFLKRHNNSAEALEERNSKRLLKNEFPQEYQSRHAVSAMRKRGVKITESEYVELRKAPNICEICGEPNKSARKKNLSVDHCHDTGKIRGLLCDNCNRGLGLFGDNVDLLLKAAEYLTVHQVDISSILDIGI